jgi:hypothetical protein
MPTKTIKLSLYALGISVAFVASNAQAQSAPPPSEGQPATPQTTAQDAPPPPPPPMAAAPTPGPGSDKTEPAPPSMAPAAPPPVNPWFVRPIFEVKTGQPDARWALQIYGFAEFDVMNDSTRSFNDGANSNVLQRDGTQGGTNGRTQFTVRNSRLGVKATAPSIGGIKGTGVVEADFFGYDPAPFGNPYTGNPPNSEAAFWNNPTFRIRHAYGKAESSVVDVLAGQTNYILGWQTYFSPTSLAFLGMPNELFNRTSQFRLSHTFKSDDVNFDVVLGAFRPIQRDSSIPDGQAALRLAFNKWKGMEGPGSGLPSAQAAAIGLSGLARRFRTDGIVNIAAPASTLVPVSSPYPSTQRGTSSENGWAVAANIFVPIIPAADNTDRFNKLSLVGEFTVGSGDADQFTGMTGMNGANWGGIYNTAAAGSVSMPNLDPGLVAFDSAAILHTINWRTFVVGLEYYLGQVTLAGTYTQGDSDNMTDLFPHNKNVFKKSQYGDAAIFFDLTPAMRYGLGYQYTKQTFCDDATAQNHRFEALALYFF